MDGDKRPVVNSVAVDPRSLDDPHIAACLDYWTEAKGDVFAPRWVDFHLHQLPARVLPYVLVLDVDGDPPEFTYRFWGSGHTPYHRRDYTGKTLTDMADAWSRDLLTQQYTAVLEARRPLVFLNSYEGMEEPLRSLRMPLSDDGRTVTHIFTFADRRGVTDALKALFSPDVTTDPD
ncbi:MAG: hypothetical protein COW30_03065 [Rhodospirillales bacterium CG15_BIG_FIL_POST_REV_8_21_14_020_66_15]|nr:MAG: hypothetical protein COW30_03065 [Rhodospirillales bacterium CG15_BIG_FIL_POST_REV_8_21_14_020_66_15]